MSITKATSRVLADQSVGTAQLSSFAVPAKLTSEIGAINFRNRVINGDMAISQRNGFTAVTSNTTGTFLYPVDRFLVFANSANPFSITTQQIGDGSNPLFPWHFRTTVNTAWNFTGTTAEVGQYAIQHRIEGNNVRDFRFGGPNAKTFTISFWVRCNFTGTFLLSFCGKSPFNRLYYTTYQINQANTWEKKIITVPGDTTFTGAGVWDVGIDNGLIAIWSLGYSAPIFFGSGIGLNTWATTGGLSNPRLESSIGSTLQTLNNKVGATFDLTGVQLEEGLVATPFEQRPIGTELVLCQRYYERTSHPIYWTGRSEVGNWYYAAGSFLVRKRVTPTVTLIEATGQFNYFYAPILNSATQDGYTAQAYTGLAGSPTLWSTRAEANAEL